jgi:hypothetical protein
MKCPCPECHNWILVHVSVAQHATILIDMDDTLFSLAGNAGADDARPRILAGEPVRRHNAVGAYC